jgi:predicted enzyme related to lactoylglutathione lyase
MTEPSAEIVDIIIDCIDPERVATFWARLLGRPIEGRKGPYIWLQPAEGSVRVSFQRVPEPKRGKNRLHFDISGPDVRHLENHIKSIGGHRVEIYDGGFLVMADPEGNEFCVVPVEPVQFDEQGRTPYLEDLPPG